MEFYKGIFIVVYPLMIECEPNFLKSEINKIETTIANPVIFGATHTQTVSDIIRIGWKISSEILNLYLLYNKFTIKHDKRISLFTNWKGMKYIFSISKYV